MAVQPESTAAANKPAPLTPSQIAIVKSTAPILKDHGVAITSHFYSTMLAANPSLHNMFNLANQATGEQPRALASLVFAFASHVDNLSALAEGVRRVAHKHVSLQVRPQQYAIVGEFLIGAVAAVLGPEVVTQHVAEAWTAAYAVLADVFISVEAELYRTHQDSRIESGRAGADAGAGQGESVAAWPTPKASEGWRPFRIQRRVNESADGGIVSFYLVPVAQDQEATVDKALPLPRFKPGQYISLRIPVPELGCVQPRQYSLSDAPGKEYYRISVKREPEHAGPTTSTPLQEQQNVQQNDANTKVLPAGLVSNILHDKYHEGDVVELTYPMGEFYLSGEHNNAVKKEEEEEENNNKSASSPSSSSPSSLSPPCSSAPLVLISAGVGITPMMSILNTVVSTAASSTTNNNKKRPITWIHGAHSDSARAFTGHVADVTFSSSSTDITTHLFTTTATTTTTTTASDSASDQHEQNPKQHRYTGHIDLSRIPASGQGGLHLDRPGAEYYICGPRMFMDDARRHLVEQGGVDEARVFREVFGVGN